MALNETIVKLYLRKLDKNSPADTCIVKPSGGLETTSTNEGDQISISKDEGTPFLEIEKAYLKVGLFLVACSTNISNEIIFKSTFQVVDSSILEITSVSPRSVTSNIYFKASCKVTLPILQLEIKVMYTEMKKYFAGFNECYIDKKLESPLFY